MSAFLSQTYPCVPSTERGRGILISGNPKSNFILYANARSVVIRNLDDPQAVSVYGEHRYRITVARFSPNGEWIASADVSGTVLIWGAFEDHVLKKKFEPFSGHIDDLQWSPDGLRIVVCGGGQGKPIVRAFMWDSGNNVGEFVGHSKQVLSCAFKPTHPFRIVTCGEDYLVNFYEGPPFKFKRSHRHHSNFVNCVRFSPDGSKCISVGSDKKGMIFDGISGDKIGELSSEDGHKGSIYAVSWSPDGKQVLTVSADKSAKVWEIGDDGSGKFQKTLHCSVADEDSVDDMLVGCLWLNTHLVVISLGGTISIFSSDDLGKAPRQLHGHMKNVTSLCVLKSSPQTLLSSSYDGLILKWIRSTGRVDFCKKEMSRVNCLAAVDEASGTFMLTYGIINKICRARLNVEQSEEQMSISIGCEPKDISVFPNCPESALISTDSGVVILRGSEVAATINVGFAVTACTASPDGAEVIVGGQDGKLHIYSVADASLQEEEAVLEIHHGAVAVVSYSPDSSMVASADSNRDTIVWNQLSKEVMMTNMRYHSARIMCLAWSPDSTMVATGSLDDSVIIYKVGEPVSSRVTITRAHLGGVYGLAFFEPDHLVSSGDDACIRVWSINA